MQGGFEGIETESLDETHCSMQSEKDADAAVPTDPLHHCEYPLAEEVDDEKSNNVVRPRQAEGREDQAPEETCQYVLEKRVGGVEQKTVEDPIADNPARQGDA